MWRQSPWKALTCKIPLCVHCTYISSSVPRPLCFLRWHLVPRKMSAVFCITLLPCSEEKWLFLGSIKITFNLSVDVRGPPHDLSFIWGNYQSAQLPEPKTLHHLFSCSLLLFVSKRWYVAAKDCQVLQSLWDENSSYRKYSCQQSNWIFVFL